MTFGSITRPVRNFFRRRRRKRSEFVYFILKDDLIERPAAPRSFVQKRIMPPASLSLEEIRRTLEFLKKCRSNRGIIIDLRQSPKGHARLKSLRDMLAEYRDSGKQVVFYAHAYSMKGYYLASVGTQLFVQHCGGVDISGMVHEPKYLAEFLEQQGIEAQFIPITPYKSAHEMFTQKEWTPEAKENLEWLFSSIFDEMIERIAEKLSISPEKTLELVDRGPYAGKQALELGLVDFCASQEEMILELEKARKSKRELHLLPFKKLSQNLPLKREPKTRIAVVSAEGMILDGESRKDPLPVTIPILGGDQAGDITVVSHFRAAEKMKHVKAVVFHINSGGGSPTASEAMCAAAAKLAKKKPVVAYFSDVAASGGYYVAMSSNAIVAQPNTITGSIGVLGGKFVTQKAYRKRGINRTQLKKGENADINSGFRPWTEEQTQRIRDYIEEVYDLFLGIVCKRTGKTREELEPLAGGRVWTGAQALEHGLIDQTGDITVAINKAAELANIKKFKVVDIYSKGTSIPASHATHVDATAELVKLLRTPELFAEELNSLNLTLYSGFEAPFR